MFSLIYNNYYYNYIIILKKQTWTMLWARSDKKQGAIPILTNSPYSWF